MISNRPSAMVIAASLALAMLGCRNEREREGMAPDRPPTGAAKERGTEQPATGVVTRVMLFGVEDRELANMAGRELSFDEPVTVTRVVSDKVFFIRDASAPEGATSREVMVYLEEERTPGTAIEGRYDIDAGDVLTGMKGELRRVEQGELQGWGLDAEAARAASDHPIYIRATELTERSEPQARRPTM